MSDDQQGMRLHGPIEAASAETECWKRHELTPVHALRAADLDEFEPGEEPLRLEAPTFVYDLDSNALPTQVQAALSKVAPNFKPLYSRTMDAMSWANACTHCGSLQGAFFLHSEPDGPFFGGPEEFNGIRVVVSEQGFDVDGASYSV